MEQTIAQGNQIPLKEPDQITLKATRDGGFVGVAGGWGRGVCYTMTNSVTDPQ